GRRRGARGGGVAGGRAAGSAGVIGPSVVVRVRGVGVEDLLEGARVGAADDHHRVAVDDAHLHLVVPRAAAVGALAADGPELAGEVLQALAVQDEDRDGGRADAAGQVGGGLAAQLARAGPPGLATGVPARRGAPRGADAPA